MAERIFKSPGVFEREIDLTQVDNEVVGVPAGIIGTAEMGPAFVPITVGSLIEFNTKFGGLNSNMFGPYAVNEFLKNRTALTYVRVLGAGANESTTDISNTQTQGIVKNAGFKLSGSIASDIDKRHKGSVQFIVATHKVPTTYETVGFPVFTDNDSFGISGNQNIQLVRGAALLSTGTRLQIMDYNQVYDGPGISSTTSDDVATISAYTADSPGYFKLIISSSAGF